LLFFSFHPGTAKISSLSQVFLLGHGLKDLDEDNFADRVALQIIIPDNPTAYELALASDIASRANFESLVIDFSLVKRESEMGKWENLENPIFIGTRIKEIQKLAAKKKIILPNLTKEQGLIFLFSYKNKKGLLLTAGSQHSLLQTGRAFFLRWPYFWEIWGREEGATYFTLEKDLSCFLKNDGIVFDQISITEALYEFFPITSPHETVKRLRFNRGELKNLRIHIDFHEKNQQEKAFHALQELRHQHKRGQMTDILTYPG
ncbi:unnamed protein product, partial [marine sediment metagenome]